MFLFKLQQVKNLNFSQTKYLRSQISSCSYLKNYQNAQVEDATSDNDRLLKKYNEILHYNCVIESKKLKLGYKKSKIYLSKLESQRKKLEEIRNVAPLPLSLRLVNKNAPTFEETEPTKEIDNEQAEGSSNFPFQSGITREEITLCNEPTEIEPIQTFDSAANSKLQVQTRNKNHKFEDIENWMTAYDNYDDATLQEDAENPNFKYGTPDPEYPSSNVPCGGCGAHLHCKDTSIPGYIPSEIFKNAKKKGGSNLEAIICQRCYFLKNYNMSLQVRVTPDEYPKILQTVSRKRALVVLMVDLLDFPCSIWPGIADIFSKMPIIVVGNKIDLIPQDSLKYLEHIKKQLLNSVRECGFGGSNILDVQLISATTGYGVEDLITTMQGAWHYKGDVYLVGCTNVGKSSLFNALLGSDYCKIQASDLIQRATTSLWPGTTLNLLKFPITKPQGFRQYQRFQRLLKSKSLEALERKLRKNSLRETNNPKFATLMGRIDRTKTVEDIDDDEPEPMDAFSMGTSANSPGVTKMGIDEKNEVYVNSRWCYDTPGVVQPDQIVHLLTTDELLLTLPKTLIRPKSFCIKPGTSIFIAGLARLDYVKSEGGSLRVTVFCSRDLPVTICSLAVADQTYAECVGTEIFKVPINDKADRMEKWPGLQLAKQFTLNGIDWGFACQDVVLSNAGWISVAGGAGRSYEMQAWTPEKRGVFLRDSILPSIIDLRGARVRDSPAYKMHKMFKLN